MIETLVLLYVIGVAGFGTWLGYAAERRLIDPWPDLPYTIQALLWPVSVFPTLGEAIARSKQREQERGDGQ